MAVEFSQIMCASSHQVRIFHISFPSSKTRRGTLDHRQSNAEIHTHSKSTAIKNSTMTAEAHWQQQQQEEEDRLERTSDQVLVPSLSLLSTPHFLPGHLSYSGINHLMTGPHSPNSSGCVRTFAHIIFFLSK